MSPFGSPDLAIVVRPAMGLIKGTVTGGQGNEGLIIPLALLADKTTDVTSFSHRDLGGHLNEALDDAGVDVEQVVTGHAGLAGDASGDDDDLGVLEGGGEAGGGGIVADDLRASVLNNG